MRRLFRQRNHNEPDPVVFRQLHDDPQGRPWYFLSLRWQAIPPLVIAVLVIGMLGAYLVANIITQEAANSSVAHVLDASRAKRQHDRGLSIARARYAGQAEILCESAFQGPDVLALVRDRSGVQHLRQAVADDVEAWQTRPAHAQRMCAER